MFTTGIAVVPLVVLISLFYLQFNKIRKQCREVIPINTQKHRIFRDKRPSTSNSIFCCSRKKYNTCIHFFSCFYLLIIYIYQNDLV